MSFGEEALIDDIQVEEPIFFDQTTRHMGSIQKNMVLSEKDRSLLNNAGMGRGGQLGFNPASTMPNYSVMGPNNKATYRQNYMQNPQSVVQGTFNMSEARLGYQQT